MRLRSIFRLSEASRLLGPLLKHHMRSKWTIVGYSKWFESSLPVALTIRSFINKHFSWGRLSITEDALNQILETENVFPAYNKLIESFASKTRDRNNVGLILEVGFLRTTIGKASAHFTLPLQTNSQLIYVKTRCATT